MTVAEAKELERLRIQEATSKRLKEFDSKQREIDGQISRRSRAWHRARTELVFARILAGLEDRIEIRRQIVSQCSALLTAHEVSQFEKSTSRVLEDQIQAVLQSFSVTGVRAPASSLAEIPTMKASTKQRIHDSLRTMQLEASAEQTLPGPTVTVNGPNARVNINSTDNSTNAVNVNEVAAKQLLLQAHPNLTVRVEVDRKRRTLTIEIANRGAYPFRLNNTQIRATDDDGEPFERNVHELSGDVLVASQHSVFAVEFLSEVKVELDSGAFEDWVRIEFDCEDIMGLVRKRYSYTRLFELREI